MLRCETGRPGRYVAATAAASVAASVTGTGTGAEAQGLCLWLALPPQSPRCWLKQSNGFLIGTNTLETLRPASLPSAVATRVGGAFVSGSPLEANNKHKKKKRRKNSSSSSSTSNNNNNNRNESDLIATGAASWESFVAAKSTALPRPLLANLLF